MANRGKQILLGIAGAVVVAEVGILLYRMIGRMMQDSENEEVPQQRTLHLAASRPVQGRVDTASEDSFPASDPPSWTGSGL